jgi:hypothetical protein
MAADSSSTNTTGRLKKKAGKLIWWAELGIRAQEEAPRDCLDVVRKLDERFPELFGFSFWGDAGFYNVVSNQNGKELMTDSRIITLDSKDQRSVRPGKSAEN